MIQQQEQIGIKCHDQDQRLIELLTANRTLTEVEWEYVLKAEQAHADKYGDDQ